MNMNNTQENEAKYQRYLSEGEEERYEGFTITKRNGEYLVYEGPWYYTSAVLCDSLLESREHVDNINAGYRASSGKSLPQDI